MPRGAAREPAREWRFAVLPYGGSKAPPSGPDLSVLVRSLSIPREKLEPLYSFQNLKPR